MYSSIAALLIIANEMNWYSHTFSLQSPEEPLNARFIGNDLQLINPRSDDEDDDARHSV